VCRTVTGSLPQPGSGAGRCYPSQLPPSEGWSSPSEDSPVEWLWAFNAAR
jgi:hypothetical protein